MSSTSAKGGNSATSASGRRAKAVGDSSGLLLPAADCHTCTRGCQVMHVLGVLLG